MVFLAARGKGAVKDIKAKEAWVINIKASDTDYKGSNSTEAVQISNFVVHNNCSSSGVTVANIHNKVKQEQLTNKLCHPTAHLWLH
jgi:hypothetical protein